MSDNKTTLKLGSISAYALRSARAHYVTERPGGGRTYEHMDRVAAATALSAASGHKMDDAMLIVAALESSDVSFVKVQNDAA